jgi:hypothetical protein
MYFSDAEKAAIAKLFAPPAEGQTKPELDPLATLDDLNRFVEPTIWQAIQKIRQLNPTEYGFKGDRLGFQDVPANMVAIEPEGYFDDAMTWHKPTKPRYLPKQVHEALLPMQAAFAKFAARQPKFVPPTPNEHGPQTRSLIVLSGYRSPAMQLLTLLRWLNAHEFDVAKTLNQVAMPEYSQHCSATNTSIDFVTIDGKPFENDLDGFALTVEYDWLTKNANQFGFVESYPKNNTSGIRWESWHWQYKP